MTSVEKAFLIALHAHEGQVRKSSRVPYIMHPVMVALTLATEGYADEVVAAALLHDVVEDTDVTEATLRSEFGDTVTDLVMGVTEDKTLPWKERKLDYIEKVKNGPAEVKAISTADKLHNAESYLDAYQELGSSMWDTFSHSKEGQVWFLEEMVKVLEETYPHTLVRALRERVDALKGLS